MPDAGKSREKKESENDANQDAHGKYLLEVNRLWARDKTKRPK
jgi:hypothetical protein